jgi:hypothetical protein
MSNEGMANDPIPPAAWLSVAGPTDAVGDAVAPLVPPVAGAFDEVVPLHAATIRANGITSAPARRACRTMVMSGIPELAGRFAGTPDDATHRNMTQAKPGPPV